jgi:ribosomal protein S18 acetylase RimI-like enzyme
MTTPSASPITYTILPIPRTSASHADLVQKFKETKLAALLAEPTGFAVKHADEIIHPLSVWESRLAAPSTILICVVTPTESTGKEEDVLMGGDWVGMATLRGPISWETYYLPESGQPVPENPERETYWHLCNIYTSPSHRGQGLAKKLVHAAVASALSQTSVLGDGETARVRLFFDSAKEYLKVLYKGLGFEEAGMCTTKEAFMANGDAALVPGNTDASEELRQRWERRFGRAMERVVDV